MNCTWKDCDNPASHPQMSEDGKTWAQLCIVHEGQLNDAMISGEPKKILSAYVKAQGGAQAAAARMMRGE